MSILGPVSGVGGSFFALCAACLRSVAGDLDGHRRDRMPNRKTGAARTPESAPCAGFCISEPYPAQKKPDAEQFGKIYRSNARLLAISTHRGRGLKATSTKTRMCSLHPFNNYHIAIRGTAGILERVFVCLRPVALYR